jgi:hypothetical protein
MYKEVNSMTRNKVNTLPETVFREFIVEIGMMIIIIPLLTSMRCILII